MTSRKFAFALVPMLALGAFGQVSAAPILVIDQQNLGPGTGIFTNFNILGDGVTQGFTPTLSGVDAIELEMRTTGTSTDIRIDVFAGDGDGGLLLGSSGVITIANVLLPRRISTSRRPSC